MPDEPTAIVAYLLARVHKLEADNDELKRTLAAVRRFIDNELREDYDEFRNRLAAFDALDPELGDGS